MPRGSHSWRSLGCPLAHAAAAAGAGTQTAINGGGLEQVFLSAAMGFVSGYAAGTFLGTPGWSGSPTAGMLSLSPGEVIGAIREQIIYLKHRLMENPGGVLRDALASASGAHLGTKMAEGVARQREKIAKTAESYEGDESFQWHMARGKFGEESYKCNHFGEVVLNESEVGAEYYPGKKWPVRANDWDPASGYTIEGFDVVARPARGDIVAFPSGNTRPGHMGIVTKVSGDMYEVVSAHVRGPVSRTYHTMGHGLEEGRPPAVFRRWVGR